jgi:hypothetical protein
MVTTAAHVTARRLENQAARDPRLQSLGIGVDLAVAERCGQGGKRLLAGCFEVALALWTEATEAVRDYRAKHPQGALVRRLTGADQGVPIARGEPGGRPPVSHVGDGWPLLERESPNTNRGLR